jgi:hypothetical protein
MGNRLMTNGVEQLIAGLGGGIDSTPDVCGGEPRITNRRIPVWTLEQARRLGTSESAKSDGTGTGRRINTSAELPCSIDLLHDITLMEVNECGCARRRVHRRGGLRPP